MRFIKMSYSEFFQGLTAILMAIAALGIAIYMLVVGEFGYAALFFAVFIGSVKYTNVLTEDIWERSEPLE